MTDDLDGAAAAPTTPPPFTGVAAGDWDGPALEQDVAAVEVSTEGAVEHAAGDAVIEETVAVEFGADEPSADGSANGVDERSGGAGALDEPADGPSDADDADDVEAGRADGISDVDVSEPGDDTTADDGAGDEPTASTEPSAPDAPEPPPFTGAAASAASADDPAPLPGSGIVDDPTAAPALHPALAAMMAGEPTTLSDIAAGPVPRTDAIDDGTEHHLPDVDGYVYDTQLDDDRGGPSRRTKWLIALTGLAVAAAVAFMILGPTDSNDPQKPSGKGGSDGTETSVTSVDGQPVAPGEPGVVPTSPEQAETTLSIPIDDPGTSPTLSIPAPTTGGTSPPLSIPVETPPTPTLSIPPGGGTSPTLSIPGGGQPTPSLSIPTDTTPRPSLSIPQG